MNKIIKQLMRSYYNIMSVSSEVLLSPYVCDTSVVKMTRPRVKHFKETPLWSTYCRQVCKTLPKVHYC